MIVVIGYNVINTVLDSVIGPRVIGRQVNLSPLLSFLSVLLWTWLLGPTGAILSVALTVLVRDLALAEKSGPRTAGAHDPFTVWRVSDSPSGVNCNARSCPWRGIDDDETPTPPDNVVSPRGRAPCRARVPSS